MSTRDLVVRLLVAWGVGAGTGFGLLFLAGIVLLVLALTPGGSALTDWAAYVLLVPTALVGAMSAAVVLWGSSPTTFVRHVPLGLVAVPGAVLSVVLIRPVLSPGALLGVPLLVETLAAAAVAVAVGPAVVATIAWARARRRGPAAPPWPA